MNTCMKSNNDTLDSFMKLAIIPGYAHSMEFEGLTGPINRLHVAPFRNAE